MNLSANQTGRGRNRSGPKRPPNDRRASIPLIRKGRRAVLLGVLALALGPLGAAAQTPDAGGPSPVQVVERFHSTLIEMMQQANNLDFDARCLYLKPVLAESFDLTFMGSKSVGRHWSKLSAEEQAIWLDKFSQLTLSNYAGRFTGFSGESFTTQGTEPAARETVVVLTELDVPGGEDVRLNYRLRRGQDGWRIIDIYLNGTVSELALRRSEYSSALKREGFAKLSAAIDEKISDLKKKDGS